MIHIRRFSWVRGISLVGVTVIFAMCVLGLNAAKKPAPATWGIRIVPYDPDPAFTAQKNVYGMSDAAGPYLYRNGEFVKITLQKGLTGDSCTIHFYLYPSEPPPNAAVWAAFAGVEMPDAAYNDVTGPLGACGFPAPFNYPAPYEGYPACFRDFVNTQHPYPGYTHFLTTLVLNADIENLSLFPIGQNVRWTGGRMMNFYLWNSFDCASAENPNLYHKVTAGLLDACSDGNRGLWVHRIDENTWDIRVEEQNFRFSESYCWQEQVVVKKRVVTETTSYTVAQGTEPLSYMFRLVKNPA